MIIEILVLIFKVLIFNPLTINVPITAIMCSFEYIYIYFFIMRIRNLQCKSQNYLPPMENGREKDMEKTVGRLFSRFGNCREILLTHPYR